MGREEGETFFSMLIEKSQSEDLTAEQNHGY